MGEESEQTIQLLKEPTRQLQVYIWVDLPAKGVVVTEEVVEDTVEVVADIGALTPGQGLDLGLLTIVDQC